jgi:uncharacterized protein (TIGR03435 family)
MLSRLCSALRIGLLLVLGNSSVRVPAQLLHASGPRPAFAVASIRPSSPQEIFDSHAVRPDSFTAQAMTLKQMISFAYGISFEGELTGGPSWIRTDRFDVTAKPDELQAAALSKVSHDDLDQQMRLMMQSLLSERFGLQLSFTKQKLPVYTLVVAKGGLKCKQVEPQSPLGKMAPPRFQWPAMPPPPPPPPGWIPPTPDEARAATQTMHMRTQYWPFWLVVTAVSHEPEVGGRVVLDKTGLMGNYDCELSWSRAGSDGSGPSFFTAIQ